MPAIIEVRARLWNATLAEDYLGVDYAEIYAKARLEVDPDISQDVSDDEVSVRTVAVPDKRRGSVDPFPEGWIVLASVVAGLVVLVLLSGVLWKLGFFDRHLPSEEEDDDADYMVSAHFEKVKLNGRP